MHSFVSRNFSCRSATVTPAPMSLACRRAGGPPMALRPSVQAAQKSPIERLEVVQLDPDKTKNAAFRGCFLVVTDPKPWGVLGYVQPVGECHGIPRTVGGLPFYRAAHGTFARLHVKAPWIPSEVAEVPEVQE